MPGFASNRNNQGNEASSSSSSSLAHLIVMGIHYIATYCNTWAKPRRCAHMCIQAKSNAKNESPQDLVQYQVVPRSTSPLPIFQSLQTAFRNF